MCVCVCVYERGVRKGGGRGREGREEKRRRGEKWVLGLSQRAPLGSKYNSSKNGVTPIEE